MNKIEQFFRKKNKEKRENEEMEQESNGAPRNLQNNHMDPETLNKLFMEMLVSVDSCNLFLNLIFFLI